MDNDSYRGVTVTVGQALGYADGIAAAHIRISGETSTEWRIKFELEPVDDYEDTADWVRQMLAQVIESL